MKEGDNTNVAVMVGGEHQGCPWPPGLRDIVLHSRASRMRLEKDFVGSWQTIKLGERCERGRV